MVQLMGGVIWDEIRGRGNMQYLGPEYTVHVQYMIGCGDNCIYSLRLGACNYILTTIFCLDVQSMAEMRAC